MYLKALLYNQEGATKQGEIVDSGPICCQKCMILEQSDWSQAGCLSTANLATSQTELASEASFRLSFLIDSWTLQWIQQFQVT